MPYGFVLKGERRTLNIERPTSNEKQTSNNEILALAFVFDSTFDVGRSFF